MSGIPANIVIMWSGAIVDIPAGWFLCNGQNGTPDLRNRFVTGSGSKYLLDEIGGNKDAAIISHTHTASTSGSANHNHTLTGGSSAQWWQTIAAITWRNITAPSWAASEAEWLANYGGTPAFNGENTSTDGAHTHSVSMSATGESGIDKNMPPYYALAYIMKGAD